MHTKKIKKILTLLGILLVIYGLLVIKISDNLSAPERRKVQDYHREWLDAPEQQAVAISLEESPDGAFPYYVVEPAGEAPAKRGQVLRDQLQARGVDVLEFGQTDQHVVLLHGRKGSKEDMLPVAERYAAAGFRCLLPDLPGHGKNPVERSCFGTDAGNRAALMSMVDAEEGKAGFSRKPVVLGMSMGGSFANQLAGAHPEAFSAVVIINSFDELGNVIDNSCGNYLLALGGMLAEPVKLCSHKVWGFDVSAADSVQAWAQCDLPLLVVHGDNDKLIPIDLGKRFYDSTPTDHKQWITVKGADHDNVLITAHPLYADTVEFIRKY